MPDAEYRLSPSVAVLIPPGMPHREASASYAFETIWILLRGEFLARRDRAIGPVANGSLAEDATRLWLAGERAAPRSGPEADGLVLALVAKLIRLFEEEAEGRKKRGCVITKKLTTFTAVPLLRPRIDIIDSID